MRIQRLQLKFGSVVAALFGLLSVAGIVWAADLQPLAPVPLPPVVAAPQGSSSGGTRLPQTLPPTVTQGPGLSTPGPLFPTTEKPAVPQPSVEAAPLFGSAPAAQSPSLVPPPILTAPVPAASSPYETPVQASAPVPVPPTPPATMAAVPEAPLFMPTETTPMTAVPEVSQPMRPARPETAAETAKKVEEEGIYFNVADEDIREVVKQISRALGKNFLLDDKLKGKVTIIGERKMTKDEVWEAFQSSLDVLGFTIVQGPAGLLRIVAVRDALSNPIDLYTDKSPFTDRYITRLITLKNISATDMANVIKGLVSKEGNLFSYPVTNTLIVTDTGTNIDRLIRLITELDQEGPQEVLEIIPILYASAKDLAGKITQIFETEKSSGGSVTPTPSPRGAKGAAAAAAETLEETPRLRKVIPDDRTNSLIVLASKMAIKKVRDLIKKLDSPLVGDEGEVHVYYLKYAGAKDMATVLNAISGQVAQAKDKDKDVKKSGTAASAAAAAAVTATTLVGGAEFSGKFTVTADESTNALVITAGSKDYNTLIEQVISKLDIPRRQVYVEAVIVELSVEESQQLGAGLLGGKSFNISGNNVSLFGSTFGFLDLNRLLAGTVGGASDQTINVNLPGTPGSTTGGETTTTGVPAFFTALQFAQNNTDVNILSTPNILTLDNQEAEIKVGQKIYQPAAQATTIGGSLQTSFTGEDVALSLKVKPQITEGGSIRMEVAQEDREALPVQQVGAGVSPIPTTLRTIKTAIVAQNHQTIVLGGLMKDKYTTSINKIPGLGDIPLLGYLFKTRTKTKKKVNLVVFMTPHIIREPRDFLTILNRKISEQNAFITDNFGKGQRKKIRESLAAHADYLLQFGAGCDESLPEVRCDRSGATTPTYVRPESDEDRFPMELVPTPAPLQEAVLPPENREVTPAPPPQGSLEDGGSEDSDSLAIEGSSRKKVRKKKAKSTAPATESQPSSASPSGDIDLAY